MLWSVYSKWLDDDQVDIEQAKLESFIGQNSPGTPPKNKDRDNSLFYKGKAGAGDGSGFENLLQPIVLKEFFPVFESRFC